MPSRVTKPRTVGSTTFNPGGFFTACSDGTIPAAPESNDLRSWVIKSYGLKEDDDYVYHAMASVTLRQVQQAINAGGQNGLHAWYRDVDGKQVNEYSALLVHRARIGVHNCLWG